MISPWTDLFFRAERCQNQGFIRKALVSDYQNEKPPISWSIPLIYTLKLPENVATFSGRLNLNVGGVNFYTRNMPTKSMTLRPWIILFMKDGNGLFTTLSYSRKGLGILELPRSSTTWVTIESHGYDNQLDINYLPAITKQHSYALAAMYPYATQPTGEFGYSGTLTYTFKRNTKLGGKIRMTFAINFSKVNSLSKEFRFRNFHQQYARWPGRYNRV